MFISDDQNDDSKLSHDVKDREWMEDRNIEFFGRNYNGRFLRLGGHPTHTLWMANLDHFHRHHRECHVYLRMVVGCMDTTASNATSSHS